MINREITEYILNHNKFAIAVHVNPDGDAIGSSVALCSALIKAGKESDIFFYSEFPSSYSFMYNPKFCHIGINNIISKFDSLICLDCASIERLGKITCKFSHFDKIINIDHHITNSGYGDMNHIEKCSATGELVFDLIKELDISFDKIISNAIYTAIITDTGRFSYEDTSKSTFMKTAELCENGLEIPYVTNMIYASRSFGATKLIGKFTDNISLQYNNKVALTHISLEEMNECSCDATDCENAIDYAREIKDVIVAIFIREISENFYKVSFRSKSDEIDVAEIASVFDGGGHKKASGCSLSGNYYTVQDKVLHLIGEYI